MVLMCVAKHAVLMQTGAGKTYTMSGESQQYSRRGITPRALHQIFEQADIRVDRQITVKVSFVEVYNEVRACQMCCHMAWVTSTDKVHLHALSLLHWLAFCMLSMSLWYTPKFSVVFSVCYSPCSGAVRRHCRSRQH